MHDQFCSNPSIYITQGYTPFMIFFYIYNKFMFQTIPLFSCHLNETYYTLNCGTLGSEDVDDIFSLRSDQGVPLLHPFLFHLKTNFMLRVSQSEWSLYVRTSTQITISTTCIVQYINIEHDIHNLHCLYHYSQGDQSSTDLFTHILLGKNKWEPRGTSVKMEFDMFHYVKYTP